MAKCYHWYKGKSKEKTNYIEPKAAIFVDNSAKERLEVYEKYKIPVFDVDGIEVLADWKK